MGVLGRAHLPQPRHPGAAVRPPADLKTIHSFDERALASDVVLAAKVYAITALRYLGLRDDADRPAL